MSDAEIEAMAARLDAQVRVEDAKCDLISDIQADSHVSDRLVANRAGFLLLAAVLLRGAVARENVVSEPIAHLRDQQGQLLYEATERREVWEPEEASPSESRSRLSLFLEDVGCYSFAGAVFFLLCVGLITVWQWIFS